MTMTQRAYDLAQLEAELKIQRLFDDWRTSFLEDRMRDNTPLGLEGEVTIEEMEEEAIEDGAIR